MNSANASPTWSTTGKTMKTIQATDYLTLELWPPPAGHPFLVLRSKGGQP